MDIDKEINEYLMEQLKEPLSHEETDALEHKVTVIRKLASSD